MLIAAHILEIALMLVLPLILARWTARAHDIRWALFGMGMLAYTAAELAGIAFNTLLMHFVDSGQLPLPSSADLTRVVAALVTGAIAGLTQEPARWLVFRRWVSDRRAPAGLMVGLGHGGMESILTALLIVVVLTTAVGLRGQTMDELVAMGFSDRTAVRVGLRVLAWWEGEPLTAVLAALRQALVLVCQVSASMWVLLAVTRERIGLLAMAIVWHAMWRGLSSYAGETWGLVEDVLILGGLTIVASAMIAYVWRALSANLGR